MRKSQMLPFAEQKTFSHCRWDKYRNQSTEHHRDGFQFGLKHCVNRFRSLGPCAPAPAPSQKSLLYELTLCFCQFMDSSISYASKSQRTKQNANQQQQPHRQRESSSEKK